ncbi:MAG: hypothetical protein LBU89_08290 [Fibromonadaceae bacterium]|jgi:hypothetical protein|nr:hypothetical protein [Fibromonadaceae bacterium]
MNRTKPILAAAIFIALALTLSCSDDNGGSPGSSSSSGTGGSFELPDISSQLYLWYEGVFGYEEYKGNGDMNFVYGYEIYDSETGLESHVLDTIPAGKIQNGQIVFDEAFDLPQNVESKYLLNIVELLGLTDVSHAQNLSAAWGFFTVVISDEKLCNLIMRTHEEEIFEAFMYIYASVSGHITGTREFSFGFTETYDMNLSKGWNGSYRAFPFVSNKASNSTDPNLIKGTLKWTAECSTY